MADRAGFVAFIRGQMGCSSGTLPDDDASIDYAFSTAQTLCAGFELVIGTPSILDMLVYNLSGHYLIVYGPDESFASLRSKYGLNSVGIINAAGDQGTSGSMAVPGWVTDFGPMESEIGKTPYGRQFLILSRSLMHALMIV